MKKIILIQPPLGRGMTKELFQPIFPYGLAYVASSLLKNGYDMEIFDFYANRWKRNTVLEKIKNLQCDLVGITAMSTQYSYVKYLGSGIMNFVYTFIRRTIKFFNDPVFYIKRAGARIQKFQ